MSQSYETIDELFEVGQDVPTGTFADDESYWQRQVAPGLSDAIETTCELVDPALGEIAYMLAANIVILAQISYLHGMKAQKET